MRQESWTGQLIQDPYEGEVAVLTYGVFGVGLTRLNTGNHRVELQLMAPCHPKARVTYARLGKLVCRACEGLTPYPGGTRVRELVPATLASSVEGWLTVTVDLLDAVLAAQELMTLVDALKASRDWPGTLAKWLRG